MFRKTNPVSSANPKKKSLSQFGLFDVPDNFDDDPEASDEDLDLEAELAAISGKTKVEKPKPKPALLPPNQLSAMIAESLRDIPSDEDVSGDDDDPDLLSELNELALDEEATSPPPTLPTRVSRVAPPPPVSETVSSGNSIVDLLQSRINNYTTAEVNAKSSGESSRARRFGRALKTLNDLMKQAKAGKPIDEAEIPPEVSTSLQKPRPEQTSTDKDTTPLSAENNKPVVDNSKLKMLEDRRSEHKTAALEAKHKGDRENALLYLKTVKQLDHLIETVNSGQDIDMNSVPPEVNMVKATTLTGPKPSENAKENEAIQTGEAMEGITDVGLIKAKSVTEAIQQHLAVYKEQESKAKEQDNSSKVRRIGRIIKQYETALKQYTAGKQVAWEELPTPPGYAPIPVPQLNKPPEVKSAEHPKPAKQIAEVTPKPVPMTRADKQLQFLLQRQSEFKQAALEAKKEGNLEEAKEYLRKAKGFDTVLEAARGGLAVDLNSLPLPPQAKQQLEDSFEMISSELDNSDDASDILSRLEEQLSTQVKLCLTTRDHNKAMGNVAETNRFERLAMSVIQDLDYVKLAKRKGQQPPKFHFEMKQFSVVQCNTDLNENDLELNIIRGINYNVNNPKEIDTYVKFEFPYPQEQPVVNKTSTVYNTNNPHYNATFTLNIQRQLRACQRVFKRHAIKIQVYSKGGIFSRDTLIGSTAIKLQPLESSVTIHEAFPLMDGRKSTGGSLEVKVRVRNPILTKQTENKTHKWLVIDHGTS